MQYGLLTVVGDTAVSRALALTDLLTRYVVTWSCLSNYTTVYQHGSGSPTIRPEEYCLFPPTAPVESLGAEGRTWWWKGVRCHPTVGSR